jgi:hypothetical protein
MKRWCVDFISKSIKKSSEYQNNLRISSNLKGLKTKGFKNQRKGFQGTGMGQGGVTGFAFVF